MAKFWRGTPPSNCDLCGKKLVKVMIDGCLLGGAWGLLCPACHKARGMGLGTGFGQKYQKQTDGKWLKVAG